MEEKKKINSRKVKITVIAICAVLLLVMGATYAWLRLTLNGSKVNVLRAGGLELTLDETSEGITLEDVVPVTDAKGLQGKEYTFTLENRGSDSSYTIYLDDVLDIDQNGENDFEESERMSDSDIKYSLIKNGKTTTKVLTETGTNPNRVLDSGIIKKGTTNTYSLRLWIKEEAENSSIMNKIFAAKLRVEAEQAGEVVLNKNIIAVYDYEQNTDSTTFCVTGEESTCQEISTKNYEPGTIIKYKVNDSTTKYFHVLHDDGDTMTLQQRENTVYNTAWYSSLDNSKGPLTILPELESATSGWTNVNNQTYTMGTTNFNNTNSYTGCTKSGCTINTYTLGQRTAKARMITMQEAIALGCTSTNKSCPNFMNNYLYNSTSYGGTVVDDTTANGASHNSGYWTMSADSSYANYAWDVNYYGGVYSLNTTYTSFGARAVVVVSK